MTKITIKESREKGAREFSTDYDFGATLKASVDKYGDKDIHDTFTAKAKICLQDFVRPLMKAGKSDKEINAEIAKWKLHVSMRVKKTPVEKIVAQYKLLDKDERKKMLAELDAA